MISNLTMQSFAMEIQISVDCLVQHFLNVGIVKTKYDVVTQTEKEILFKYMNNNKTAVFNQFYLQRKTHSILNISGISGKNKRIQIEVRKKCVYVQCTAQKSELINSCELKNKIQSKKNTDNSISIESRYDPIYMKKNNMISNNLLKQNLKKSSTQSNLFTLHNQPKKNNIYPKEDGKLSKRLNQNKLLNSSKDVSVHIYKDKLNVIRDKKNDYNHGELCNTAVLEMTGNNNNKKTENVRRYHQVRSRSRYRIGGKLNKQKRNNNHRIYADMIHSSDKEEEIYKYNRINKNKRKQSVLVQGFSKPSQIISRNIVIGETISVLELSSKMSVKSSYMIQVMTKLGLTVTINQLIDQETAQLVIEEMGHHAVLRRENDLEDSIMNDSKDNANNSCSINDMKEDQILYKNRAPIVTMMGHVDHGKTSLLDYIRSTKIVDSESGGITQKIGAYSVNIRHNMVTFLDTPGHAAFTSMRARGVQLTDIVVLVVAADDGVMPQTIEAIKHIQVAQVPVVVAINKIDKLEVNIDQIKNELNHYGLVPEEWGGNTQYVNVSAVSGIGIDKLLDSILLQSEILGLEVMHCGKAKAIVIESSIDKGRGPVVTVLIREGILKCGDVVLCGSEYGRVRAMRDERGMDINTAGPSIPIELLGLSGAPESGEILVVVQNEKRAREVALYRQNKRREIRWACKKESSKVENIFDTVDNIKVPQLNFVVKADARGSVQVICDSLEQMSNDKIKVNILFASIGNVTETDSVLAMSSNAIILGFNVKVDSTARRIIELDDVDIRYYSVIYNLLNEVKQMINKILTPQYICEIIGSAQVNSIFRSPKHGNIAGCMVVNGVIKRFGKVKIVRNDVVVHEGVLESLRRFKNDVNEVKNGIECGISIKNYNDIQVGDIIEILDITKKLCL